MGIWKINNYAVILVCFVFHACMEERVIVNHCTDMDRKTGPVPFRTFAEVSDDSINCVLDVTEFANWHRPVLYVVNDYEALDTLLECSSNNFDFNFDEYTLLIGYFYTEAGPAALSKQEVKLDCETKNQLLYYSVTVDQMGNDGFQNILIQHNAIVPKLPDDLRVSHWVKRNRLYLEESQITEH